MKLKCFILASVFGIAGAVQAADVTLQWDPVTNDSRVMGYELHHGPSSGVYDSMLSVDGVSTNTVEVMDLDNGSAHYFAVRSRNDDGTLVSAFSNEVDIDPMPGLTPPGSLQFISVSAQIDITVNSALLSGTEIQ